MAQYPTAVPTFTAKTDGVDYPQAAHVNSLQDEVTAIADGLKNGLQHQVTIATGGLTVTAGGITTSTGNTVLGQNLSVAGNSTMSGLHVSSNLQVDGTSTFAGGVTFSGPVTFTVTPGFNIPRVRLTISANQDLPATANTGLSWPVEDYDSHGMHSTASNSSRITFVDSSGVYHIGATVDFANASSGVRAIRILLGDSTATVVAASGLFATVAPAFTVPLSVSADVRIADTATYATVQVVNGAASTNSATSTGSYVTAFWAHKVSS